MEKTINAIQILKAKGVYVQTTTVVHHDNFSDLDDIYKLMCELKVDSWRVINLEPIMSRLQDFTGK